MRDWKNILLPLSVVLAALSVVSCSSEERTGYAVQAGVLGEAHVPERAVIVDEEQAADYLLELINRDRRQIGLEPLKLDDKLSLAAADHSREMIELGYFSHLSPIDDHKTYRQRIRAAGITDAGVGENLAREYSRDIYDWRDLVERAHAGLMLSPGHRDNLLNPEYNRIGLGVIKGRDGDKVGLHITENFSTRVFAIDGLDLVLLEADGIGCYRLTIRGRQLERGCATVLIDRSPYGWSPVVTDDGGHFNVEVSLPVDTGRRLISIGIGPERLGRRLLYNEWFVDTDAPAGEALIIEAPPY